MKTIRSEPFGPVTLRIVEDSKGYKGGVIRKGEQPDTISGNDLDIIWAKLKDMAGQYNSEFIGFEGARTRFLRIFPEGFNDPGYIGDSSDGERSYKLAAVAKLEKMLPLKTAKSAEKSGEAALAIYRALNLLAPFEQMRVQDLLRSDDADAFIHMAATLAEGDLSALERMKPVLSQYGAEKWTIATFLPFLWRASDHMFLKPNVTRDFAERVGHPLAHGYQSQLNVETYNSLLDLVEKTKAAISDLCPQDNIDIQSFIWVVGEYEEPKAYLIPTPT
jgi:hypothetical protein